MDKRQLIDLMMNKPTPFQVWVCEVTGVNGLTCSVQFINSELEVDDVSLVANPEAEEYFVLIPKDGSRVLVGLIQNEIGDLYLAQVSEVEKILYKSGKVSVEFSSEGVIVKNDKSTVLVNAAKVTLESNQTTIVIDDKIEIKNAGASLATLFSDLITLLNSFSVLCAAPGSPSAGLNPATIALLTQFQAKTNLLLK